MDADTLKQALQLLGTDVKPGTIAVYARTHLQSTSAQVMQRKMPTDAAVAAHELFSLLREFDDAERFQ